MFVGVDVEREVARPVPFPFHQHARPELSFLRVESLPETFLAASS